MTELKSSKHHLNGYELLVLVWLITAFVADIPRPMLVLTGPQGSAKTTAATIIRGVIDPSVVDSLDMGRGDRAELAQALHHHAVPCFDNITAMQKWHEDMLCRAVTGGAFSKRMLYSDDDDVLFSFMRAIMLTGINCPTTAPDLLDRCLLVPLDWISKGERKRVKHILSAFEKARPRILGGALDVLAEAMRIRRQVKLPHLTRMADFTQWGAAVAVALGYDADTFLTALARNTDSQIDEVLENDPVGQAVLSMARRLKHKTWSGTATELLSKLRKPHSIRGNDSRWPADASTFARSLRILKGPLAEKGIEVGFSRGRRKGRIITIRNTRSPSATSSPSPPSSGHKNTSKHKRTRARKASTP